MHHYAALWKPKNLKIFDKIASPDTRNAFSAGHPEEALWLTPGTKLFKWTQANCRAPRYFALVAVPAKQAVSDRSNSFRYSRIADLHKSLKCEQPRLQ